MPSRADSCDHGGNADEGDDAANILGECRQAERGADIVEPAHQEGFLAHPLFDRAEGMLHAFTPQAQHVGPSFQSSGHLVEQFLAFVSTDLAELAVGASRAQCTSLAGSGIGIVDELDVPDLAALAGGRWLLIAGTYSGQCCLEFPAPQHTIGL